MKLTLEQFQNCLVWIEKLLENPPKAMGQLKDDDSMCCLGVATDVFRTRTKRGTWVFDSFCLDGSESSFKIPIAIAQYYGMPSDAGFLIPDRIIRKHFPSITEHQQFMTILNDFGEKDHQTMGLMLLEYLNSEVEIVSTGTDTSTEFLSDAIDTYVIASADVPIE